MQRRNGCQGPLASVCDRIAISDFSRSLAGAFRFSSGSSVRTLRSPHERDPPLSLLPKLISAFSAPSPTTSLQSAGLSAPAPREFSPPEAGDGCRVSPSGTRQPKAVVGRTPRLPERAPESEPRVGGEEPSKTAPS